MLHAVAWMNLENSMLSKRKQTPKTMYAIIKCVYIKCPE